MAQPSGSPGRAVAAILPALVVLGGLLVRLTAWPTVFEPERVNFRGQDAWYHLRVIDHLVQNFPARLTVDPYVAPGGQHVPVAPLFDHTVAGVAWAAGLGHPSVRVVETVAALLPPLFGALTVALVFLIGCRLFDRRTGLIAGALVAIMPSQFLERTMLGFADHHAMETALAFGTVLALVTALEARPTATRAAATRSRAIGVGAVLGAYLLTWGSGAFLVLALTLWLWIQTALDRWHGRHDGLSPVIGPAALTALACVLLLQSPDLRGYNLQVGSLCLLGLSAIGLDGVQVLLRRWRVRPAIGVTGIAVLAASAVLAFSMWAPAGQTDLRGLVARLGSGEQSFVVEAQPLLVSRGVWSFEAAWLGFRTAFLIGVPALVMLAVQAVRDGSRSRLVFLVWTTVTLAATLHQNRFGYYLGPNLALFTGWAASRLLARAGLPAAADPSVAAGVPAAPPAVPGARPWRTSLAVIAVAGVVFAPHLRAGIETGRVPSGQSPAWHAALEWLRTNTPEPFGSADYYVSAYDPANLRQPAYTVMNWWDYGYWIVRTARRVPVANPTQAGSERAGRFFTATSSLEANPTLAETGARYVLVDDRLPLGVRGGRFEGLFDVMATLGRIDRRRFYGTYLERRPGGGLAPVQLFYPDYYNSMAVRLAVLDGLAASPTDVPWVISTEAPRSVSPWPVVTTWRSFPTFAEAERYVGTQASGTHGIVCRDPTRPCIPVAALEDYRLVYGAASASEARSPVRVFEHRP